MPEQALRRGLSSLEVKPLKVEIFIFCLFRHRIYKTYLPFKEQKLRNNYFSASLGDYTGYYKPNQT